ncbi:SDR family NAD(P)-dependent oxidoreductase [Frankia sp. EAN1pec]|uniref:SDR family NAD(P)-dependent oxidoreductase n=1 Tax=Parafrankia sp. (strain EAN1pec) TaxID=298653 RepID=UPI0012F7E7FE
MIITLPDQEVTPSAHRMNVRSAGGIGPPTFTSFATADLATEIRQIDVNILSPMSLAHAALGRMLAESKGTLLTISSLDAILPAPYHATYAATKALVNSFFEGLHEELRDTPVTVTTVMPGYVRTEFTERAGVTDALDGVPRILIHAPERVARSALAAAASQKAMSAPGPIYTAYAAVMDSLPRGIRRRLSNRIVPNHSQGPS